MLAAIAGMVALRLLAKGAVSQRTLSDFASRFGELAPLVFVLFLGARPLTLLPGQVLAAVGGLLFGARMGTIYALIGSFLSCALIFAIARFAGGGRLMKRLAGQRYEAMVDVTREHNFKLSVIATMNPLVPTDVFIAAAASARARFGPLVLGVLVGTLPGTYVTALFGSSLGQGKTITTAVTAAGMVLSLVLGLWLGRTVVREVHAGRVHAGKASRASTASRTAPASRSLAAGSSTF
ncbi:MAG TPA: VTT domain-containing protein [Myxococcaceae bacterium]|nr:VTT domain-containing protein [Myxococcaceae bacterium]